MNNIIAGYRRMLSMTQVDMARKFGVSRQAYYLKEKGQTPFSDKEKVIFKDLISTIFPDITIDEIFLPQMVRNAKRKR